MKDRETETETETHRETETERRAEKLDLDHRCSENETLARSSRTRHRRS